MLETVREALTTIPYGGVSLAVIAAVWLAQVATIIRARRGRTSPAAHLAAGASILSIPLVAALSVHAARVQMLDVFSGGPQPAKVLSAGISGQLNAIPMAASGVLIAGALWAIGLVGLGRRAPERPAASWAPAALVALGLLATCMGVIQWSAYLIQVFASIVELEPERKVSVLNSAVDFGRAHLFVFGRISRWTIAVLAVAAGVWVARVRAPLSRRSSVRCAIAAGLLLAFAGLLALAARPLQAENELPWPAPGGGERLLVIDPVTPDLTGPDAIERAPVVQVWGDRLALDGTLTSREDLTSKLQTLRNNFGVLSPGAPFDGLALIVADRAAPMRQVIAVLSAVQEAGYRRPLFTFTRPETIVRPTFGPLRRVTATGVRATLFDPADDELDAQLGIQKQPREPGVVVRPATFDTYEPFARKLLAVRQAGRSVTVQLGK